MAQAQATNPDGVVAFAEAIPRSSPSSAAAGIAKRAAATSPRFKRGMP
ncbi:hypothetical protein OP10G_0518 [Fimbriimonas ginsengisoli Gsoil 348]|uniref:Uncharacterized protein n=1 Tax=Fimbriimonas ginsengisoli Gsoil 348 TaxID=661478 RepID=A0A068NK56_FIMGI|nr:hypothetical protein OP10G_0518 [Fimbriimonas ginsengisoli Gsoil 348]